MHFTYCPYCGTKLINKKIGDESVIPFCINCNIPFWDMFTTCIIAAVVNVEKLEFINSYPYEKKEMLMLGYKVWGKKQNFEFCVEVDSVE